MMYNEVDIALTSGGETLVGLGLLVGSMMTVNFAGRTLEIVQQ